MKIYQQTTDDCIKGFTYEINGWLGFEIGYEEAYDLYLDKVRIIYYLR